MTESFKYTRVHHGAMITKQQWQLLQLQKFLDTDHPETRTYSTHPPLLYDVSLYGSDQYETWVPHSAHLGDAFPGPREHLSHIAFLK